MGQWNYWQGGSLGSLHMLLNSFSILTILRPSQRPQLYGSSPSSPPKIGVIICSSKKSDASTTLLPLLKCIDTTLLIKSEASSLLSSITSQTPSPPPATALMPAASCMTSVVEICKQVPNSMAPELFFVLSTLSQEYFMKLFIKCMTNTTYSKNIYIIN